MTHNTNKAGTGIAGLDDVLGGGLSQGEEISVCELLPPDIDSLSEIGGLWVGRPLTAFQGVRRGVPTRSKEINSAIDVEGA